MSRICLDDLTSADLNQLYTERDRYRAAWTSARHRAQRRDRMATHRLTVLRKRRQQIRAAEDRAEQAEAAATRVRAVLATRDWPYAEVRAADIRAALDDPHTT
ncbi:hypothetical protein ACFCV8_00825 [Streptomyces sp. NPDC056347]|uniref:hypothetical protein n=1 Tax=Streptomyces sp. NPDC056347 TaxID=3345790 RepID=UPI0035E087E4